MHLASLQFNVQLEALINSHTISLPLQDESNTRDLKTKAPPEREWKRLDGMYCAGTSTATAAA